MSETKSVYKYLDVSMKHITAKDAEILEEADTSVGGLAIDHVVVNGDLLGHWVGIYDHLDDVREEMTLAGFSDAFFAIVAKAFGLDCLWVRVDRDGELHEDLEQFEEESR